jgi:hypothetical protein
VPLTLSRSPLRAATRRILAIDQKSPEPRRSSIPVRRPRRRRSTVNPRWDFSPDLLFIR